MDNTVIVAIISFAGTLLGTAGGIITSAKLTKYRLEQIEKRVETISNNISKLPVIEERFVNINRRVNNLEKQNINYRFFESGQ